MAGAGSRFSKAGFKDPKPLIPIHNIPMIQLIIENLSIGVHQIESKFYHPLKTGRQVEQFETQFEKGSS